MKEIPQITPKFPWKEEQRMQPMMLRKRLAEGGPGVPLDYPSESELLVLWKIPVHHTESNPAAHCIAKGIGRQIALASVLKRVKTLNFFFLG